MQLLSPRYIPEGEVFPVTYWKISNMLVVASGPAFAGQPKSGPEVTREIHAFLQLADDFLFGTAHGYFGSDYAVAESPSVKLRAARKAGFKNAGAHFAIRRCTPSQLAVGLRTDSTA